jgi:5-bromo-4-chloroindolyl phosphate hydrolysis protein
MTLDILYKQIKRLAIFLIGISIVLIGGVLFFTPGPAIIVIPIGLAILATEFIWAKKLLKKFKEATLTISQTAKDALSKKKDL